MRFSEHFDIAIGVDDDWFDLLLNQDTPLYIDPYLVFDDNDPLWAASQTSLVQYFEQALELVLKSRGVEGSPAWKAAVRLLKCPEPNQFCLGLSAGDPRGSGIGEKTATEIARVLDLVRREGATELASVAGFTVFVERVGVDMISDALCNVLKGRFIKYTQSVARRHDIRMQSQLVTNARLDPRRGWRSDDFELPHNALMGTYVLLVPSRFLRDIPILGADTFFDWVDENSQLRDQLNLDVAQQLSKSDKVACARAVAMRDPQLAIEFLREFNRTHHSAPPYDVRGDPKGLVSWFEAGIGLAERFAARNGNIRAAATTAEVPQFTKQLAYAFKNEVEERGGWKILWDSSGTSHQREEVAQALAGAMWRAQCKASNVDISKEVNIGRGPVDFKFSAGFNSRALIEVKHIGSSKLLSGARKQLPQYMKSEEIQSGVYLAIGYADRDFADERIREITDACAMTAEQRGIDIAPVIVDARPSTKTSASNLR